jgi:hypothetical protein
MVLEARGGADLVGKVRNYSFSCMNIYFISMCLDSSSTPLSPNHPNKSRHVLKKIGLEMAEGGQFLLGPFYYSPPDASTYVVLPSPKQYPFRLPALPQFTSLSRPVINPAAAA